MSEKTCTLCCQTKPISEFYRSTRDRFTGRCRLCLRATARKRWQTLPHYRARCKVVTQLWRKQNREWARFNHLLHTYGLTLDQYAALEESQDFHCAICPADTRLHVDHNHETDKVRGLLCGPCNMGLGNFGDEPERLESAKSYLQRVGHYGYCDMNG